MATHRTHRLSARRFDKENVPTPNLPEGSPRGRFCQRKVRTKHKWVTLSPGSYLICREINCRQRCLTESRTAEPLQEVWIFNHVRKVRPRRSPRWSLCRSRRSVRTGGWHYRDVIPECAVEIIFEGSKPRASAHKHASWHPENFAKTSDLESDLRKFCWITILGTHYS